MLWKIAGVLTVYRQNWSMILLSQLADEFTCHHERFLVGKTDFLVRLDGMDGGESPAKPTIAVSTMSMGSASTIWSRSFACIDLDVGLVGEQVFQFVIPFFVGQSPRRQDDICAPVLPVPSHGCSP